MDAKALSAMIAALWTPGNPNPVVVLRPSRTVRVVIIVVAASFLAMLLFLPGDPGRPSESVMRWVFGVVVGLMMLGALVAMLPGSSALELRRDGFTTVQMFRRTTTLWTQTGGFRVGKIRVRSPPFVLVDLSGPAAERPSARIAAVVSGAHSALPETYGLTAAELAWLMNEMRDRALAGRL